MKPDPSEVSKCAVGLPFAMPSRRGTGINVEFGHVETKKNKWLETSCPQNRNHDNEIIIFLKY